MVWRARARHVTRGRRPATGDRNARAIDPCVDDGDVDAAAGQLGPVQRGDAESPGHVLRGTNGGVAAVGGGEREYGGVGEDPDNVGGPERPPALDGVRVG